MQPHKPYTFTILDNQQHKPKTAKEYVFANASKFAEKKYENTTTYIKNSGFST